MRVVIPNKDELSDDWKIAKGQIQQTLKHLSLTVNRGWTTEHTIDGGHGDITATSVEVQGAVMGEWFDLPFADARFFAEGSSVWTVTAANLNYLKAVRLGQLVHVMFRVEGTTITVDTSATLFISLPEFNAIPLSSLAVSVQTWYGGMDSWSDIQHSTSGIGPVSAIAQPYDPRPLTLLQLGKIGPTNATGSSFAISSNFNIGGICTFPVNIDNLAVPYSFS